MATEAKEKNKKLKTFQKSMSMNVQNLQNISYNGRVKVSWI